MVKTIKAIAINKSRILLCRKIDIWDLPGGKPNKGESDLECLAREISLEEIPGTDFEVIRYYGKFTGLSPHKKQPTSAKTYRIKIKKLGRIPKKREDFNEIEEIRWVKGKNIGMYVLSETTSKAVYSLIKRGYL